MCPDMRWRRRPRMGIGLLLQHHSRSTLLFSLDLDLRQFCTVVQHLRAAYQQVQARIRSIGHTKNTVIALAAKLHRSLRYPLARPSTDNLENRFLHRKLCQQTMPYRKRYSPFSYVWLDRYQFHRFLSADLLQCIQDILRADRNPGHCRSSGVRRVLVARYTHQVDEIRDDHCWRAHKHFEVQ